MESNLPAKQDKKKQVAEFVEQGSGRIPVKGSYYQTPGGDFEADAWRVQQDANKAGISTEVILAEQSSEKVKVVARAHHPDGWYVDGVVNHEYDTVMGKKIMEMYKKVLAGKAITFGEPKNKKRIGVFKEDEPPFFMGADAKLVPNLTPLGTAKILDDMLRFRDISIRDATSKAMRIAQLKALNEEWREQDEIEAEEQEVKDINKGKDVKKVNQETVDKAQQNKAKEKKKPVQQKQQGKTVSKEERQKAINEVMAKRGKEKKQSEKREEGKKGKKEKNVKEKEKEKSKSVKKTGSTQQKGKTTTKEKPEEKLPSGIEKDKVQDAEITGTKKKKGKTKDKNRTQEGKSRWKGFNGKQIIDLIRKTKKTDEEEPAPGIIKMELFNLQKGKLITKEQFLDAKRFLEDITE